MKSLELLDAASAHVLGFEWLRTEVAPISSYGDRLFIELRPFVSGEESSAQERAATIADLAIGLDGDRIDAIRAVLGDAPDVNAALARASMDGVLDDSNFLELNRFCAAIERIDALTAHVGPQPISNAAVCALRAALSGGSRDETGFYLADSFDGELANARARLAREQAELDASRGRETERALRALGRDGLEADEFIVMRSDIRSPLPAGVRVVREAPTYLLCALEYGEASLAALARRDAAAQAVADAEERVRERLSTLVRERVPELDATARALGRLDVLLAAARFAQRHHCVPASLTAEPVLAFERARFLPLEAELTLAGRPFVPLDLELRDAAVLTGPNMGGKSVSLKTCGFVALCAAFGLPVPAARARCALFDQIAWLGLGREAQIEGLLSSFAREVLELKSILERAAPQLLILVDEFARTTTPHEGKALVVALLERLRRRGAVGMLATHLGGIAAAAGVRHFAVRGLRSIPRSAAAKDVDEALAALAGAMDYTIGEVTAEESPRADAVALTALLGLDEEFVEAARRALMQ